MSTVFLNDLLINTRGCLPNVGDVAPSNFLLVDSDFRAYSLDDFSGKRILINVYPGIDTPSGLNSIKKCNEMFCDFSDLVVLCVSIDLPFTLRRVKEENSLNRILLLSDYKNRNFGDLYGLTMIDGPISGMLSSCVIVLDSSHNISYVKRSCGVSEEPDLIGAFENLQSLENICLG